MENIVLKQPFWEKKIKKVNPFEAPFMATPMSPESNEKQQLIVTVDSGEMGV